MWYGDPFETKGQRMSLCVAILTQACALSGPLAVPCPTRPVRCLALVRPALLWWIGIVVCVGSVVSVRWWRGTVLAGQCGAAKFGHVAVFDSRLVRRAVGP